MSRSRPKLKPLSSESSSRSLVLVTSYSQMIDDTCRYVQVVVVSSHSVLPRAPASNGLSDQFWEIFDRMLYTPSLGQLIAWTDDGRAFTVFHPTEFARNVLPQFFKHSNFASFIRRSKQRPIRGVQALTVPFLGQLNMYGFGKRVSDEHPMHHRGEDGS